MNELEPKKLALLRILQILKEYSDYDHRLTQEDIANYLEGDYGIVIERKAISRNISLLKEAGIDIESTRTGTYLASREFENSELHMLIDGVLSSKHITVNHSKNLIDRLCTLSNKYFRSSVKNIYSVNDWSKTDNQSLFYNIEIIDTAIEQGKQIYFDFNKYGLDKKLHPSSRKYVSPYQMILHNQRYYLMGKDEHWKDMAFYRMDHITNMIITDKKATSIRKIKGYEHGIDYKKFSSMPYMFNDKPQTIRFIADVEIIDDIVEWFGRDVKMSAIKEDDNKVMAVVKASPYAMEHWAMQYINYVEIIIPDNLRKKIQKTLIEGLNKYNTSHADS